MDELFEQLRSLALSFAAPYTSIEHGAMPSDASLSMYFGAGYTSTMFFDRGAVQEIFVALNGKHPEAKTLVRAMDNIHNGLRLATAYPSGAGWKILLVETNVPPHYLGRENSMNKGGARQWLYGSILKIKIQLNGGC